MENKEESTGLVTSEVTIRFTSEAEKECYIRLRSTLIKLLYMIEEEQKGEGNAELFLYGVVYELASNNVLCHEKLTQVLGKIHGLYYKNQYKSMTHAQIKRQIMESRGIVDHLIKDLEQGSKK